MRCQGVPGCSPRVQYCTILSLPYLQPVLDRHTVVVDLCSCVTPLAPSSRSLPALFISLYLSLFSLSSRSLPALFSLSLLQRLTTETFVEHKSGRRMCSSVPADALDRRQVGAVLLYTPCHYPGTTLALHWYYNPSATTLALHPGTAPWHCTLGPQLGTAPCRCTLPLHPGTNLILPHTR